MRDSDWKKIQAHYVDFLNDLNPDELISYLYQDKVLSDKDLDDIKAEKTRREKVQTFLDILKRTEVEHDDVYAVFYRRLVESHHHLAQLIKAPRTVKRTARTVTDGNSKEGAVRNLESLNFEELSTFLEPIFKEIGIDDYECVLKTFQNEMVNGRVFTHITDLELKEICPDLKFGHRKQIILERDEILKNVPVAIEDENKHKGGESEEQREYPRKFGTTVHRTEKYTKGKVLENVSPLTNNLIDPVHHCISFGEDIDDDSALETIGWETVKFTAACINERTNGTLYFGVHDGKDGTHDRGMIEGLQLRREDCDTEISTCVRKSFKDDKLKTVNACLQSPKYVDVICYKEKVGFVLEIDVIPKSDDVKEEVFHVTDEFSRSGSKKSEKKIFILQDGSPFELGPGDIVAFMVRIKELTRKRQDAEKRELKRRPQQASLLLQLQEFLCDGDKTMGDIYPILVLSPLDNSTITTTDELCSKFSFISEIDWICVFDFDSNRTDSGMFTFLEKEKNLEFKIKHTEDFDQKNRVHPQQNATNDRFHEEMTSSNLTPWIFCNGFEELGKSELDERKWKAERSEGFKEAVRYFSHQIPTGRAKVVQLLLSKDYGVMLEGAEEFCLKFQNQWIVVAETESIAAQWQEQVICRNIVNKTTLEKQSIVGSNWEDISNCTQEITRLTKGSEVRDEGCSLVTHLGTQIKLPRNTQNMLCDIEVLSSTECEVLNQLHDEEELKIVNDHETKFYQGNPPSWLNFQRSHVLQRSNYQDLHGKVDQALKGDIPDNVNIGKVTIFHQPGAGGTTIAKHVLWNMKNSVRCCVLTSFSNESADQVVDLWTYGESEVDKALPVLLLIDNLDEEKLQELWRSLQEKADNYLQGLPRVMCVLLICHRQSSFPSQIDSMNFFLKQNLDQQELCWFQSKYDYLAEVFKKKKGPDPKNLLSLNIMKENFSEKFIETTVTGILQDICKSEERDLLKFVSLLNAYDQKFRGIPVPCFDTLMNKHFLQKKRWEKCLSTAAFMLLSCSKQKQICIRVVNPLLSKWILQLLMKESKQNLGDTMLNFLLSESCQVLNRNVAFTKLSTMLREMMKIREVTASGKKAMFSRLIQELYDSNLVDIASEILEIMFDKTFDPFIAQQLARLYILCENWDKAKEFAEKGTNLKPDNSYLWDTHGQICKMRLAKLFDSPTGLDIEKTQFLMQEGFDLACEGVKHFSKVQELSDNEKQNDKHSEPNIAGFIGELEIVISIFDLLCRIPEFKVKSRIHDFLNGKTNVPKELIRITPQQRHWLFGLKDKTVLTLRALDDEAFRFRSKEIASESRTYQYFLKTNLERLRQSLGSYLGDGDLQSYEEAILLSPDQRRGQVRRLGLYSLQTIFKYSKQSDVQDKLLTVHRIMIENAKLPDPEPYDCRIALGTAVALLQYESCAGLASYEDLLQASYKLYCMERRTDYIDLEPFLYLLLLHWPTGKRHKWLSLCETAMLPNAIQIWNAEYAKKYPQAISQSWRREPPFIFITNQDGIESIVHINQLKERIDPQKKHRKHQLGKVLDENRHVLERFEGMLSGSGWEMIVRLETSKGLKLPAIKLPLHTREERTSILNKKVTFVIGFGWSGIKACDVQVDSLPMPTTQRRKPKVHLGQHLNVQPIHLYRNLSHEIMTAEYHLHLIADLKRTPRNKLTLEQIHLLRQEAQIKTQRDQLLRQRYHVFQGST